MKPDYRLKGASILLLLGAAGASQAAPPIACNALLNSTIEGATITSAQLNAASGSVPDHCEVLGVINQRTGVDGQPYAIKFHLRMPTAWNERFYFQGGGGTDGNLGAATPAQLGQGYAVVSTDSGHDNAVNTTRARGQLPVRLRPSGAQRLRLQRARAGGERRQSHPEDVSTATRRSSPTSKGARKAGAKD